MLTAQTLTRLSEKQQELDSYIQRKHNLKIDQKNFTQRIVAFFVELGEFANQERSFKFWSQKTAGPKNQQLEEYIDGLHFLLSLGNSIQYNFAEHHYAAPETSALDLTNQYLALLGALCLFHQKPAVQEFNQLLNHYLAISVLCGYQESELLETYQQKNKVNFQRQQNNY